MMLGKYFLVILLFITTHGHSQSTEDSVKATIRNLFTAMKTSDGDLMKNCFAENAILETISKNKQTGAVTVRHEAVGGFIEQISKLPKDSADERIQFETIKVDADLASVWTPYRFYYNGNFSHCGVNSFQLVRVNGFWKIQYLIDTRRKEPCE